jgi:hypothetical protein
MGNNHIWKKRSYYGKLLHRKIILLNKILGDEIKKGIQADFEKIATFSRTIDYSVQVQLSNITRIEDIDMLQKMEGVEVDSSHAVQEIPTNKSADNIFN